MTKKKAIAFKILTTSRILFLCLCTLALGEVAHSFIFGQQATNPFAQAVLSERLTKNEVEVQMMTTEIAILRQTVAEQDKDISELHGIGIGLGSLLLVLQIIQMVVGRMIGFTPKREG